MKIIHKNQTIYSFKEGDILTRIEPVRFKLESYDEGYYNDYSWVEGKRDNAFIEFYKILDNQIFFYLGHNIIKNGKTEKKFSSLNSLPLSKWWYGWKKIGESK